MTGAEDEQQVAADEHLLRAPWNAEQVAGLNRFQAGPFHPYTCGNDSRHILTATELGWVCPQCDYTQDWASDFAADMSIVPAPFVWPPA